MVTAEITDIIDGFLDREGGEVLITESYYKG
jgi:hypothetical protein